MNKEIKGSGPRCLTAEFYEAFMEKSPRLAETFPENKKKIKNKTHLIRLVEVV